MIHITPGQAILLYAQIHPEPQSRDFYSLVFLYVDGITRENAGIYQRFCELFISHPTLSQQYVIIDNDYLKIYNARFPASPIPYDKSKLLDALTKDPSRRVFETVLARESLLEPQGLKIYDTFNLDLWLHSIYIQILRFPPGVLKTPQTTEFFFKFKTYEPLSVRDSDPAFLSHDLRSRPLNSEIYEALKILCSSDAFENDRRLIPQTQNKIKLFLTFWYLVVELVETYQKTIMFPRVYFETAIFQKTDRGRELKYGEDVSSGLEQGTQAGLNKSLTPLPYHDKDLRFFRPYSSVKPVENSRLVYDSRWADILINAKTQIFVNSISGVMLMFMRMMCSFQNIRAYKTSFDPQRIAPSTFSPHPLPSEVIGSKKSLLRFLKYMTSIIVYCSGGHPYFEIVQLLKLEEIRVPITEILGYPLSDTEISDLFIENKSDLEHVKSTPLMYAFWKAADYNKTYLEKMAVNTHFHFS